jgi:pimeloyl-ACP methyl ester carboxylesterase
MDYFSHAFDDLLGISLAGRRVFDLLRTCDLLVQEGAKKIRLVGRGQGALLAAFAAALHPAIKTAELHDSPTSFEDWVAADDLSWPASLIPKGCLKTFDLPDFRQAFRGKLSVKSYWTATECEPPPSQ